MTKSYPFFDIISNLASDTSGRVKSYNSMAKNIDLVTNAKVNILYVRQGHIDFIQLAPTRVSRLYRPIDHDVMPPRCHQEIGLSSIIETS